MVGEEKRHQMMQNLFGDQSEEEEEEVESEHESNRRPDYASVVYGDEICFYTKFLKRTGSTGFMIPFIFDDGDGAPEPEDEGEGEVAIEDEGEPQDLHHIHGESEGERDHSPQEVEFGDQKEESEGRYLESDEEEHERVVTSRGHDEAISESEGSGESRYAADENDEVNHARSPSKSPAQENDEDQYLNSAPEIRDVFGDSEDEEQAAYETHNEIEEDENQSPINEDMNYEKELRPEDIIPDEDAPYYSEEDQTMAKPKEKPVGPPLELEVPLQPPPAESEKMNMIKVSNIMGIDPKPFDPHKYVDKDVYVTDESGSKKRIRLDNNVVRWRKVKNPNGTTSIQSNARFVEWSDGSLQLLIGNEVLDISKQDAQHEQTHLFLSHGKVRLLLYLLYSAILTMTGILQSQGRILTKMRFMPSSLLSNSHRLLTALVDSRHKKVYKVKNCITEIDPEMEKDKREKAVNQSIKANELLSRKKEKVNRKYTQPIRRERQLSPGFLEDALDEGHGPKDVHRKVSHPAPKSSRRPVEFSESEKEESEYETEGEEDEGSPPHRGAEEAEEDYAEEDEEHERGEEKETYAETDEEAEEPKQSARDSRGSLKRKNIESDEDSPPRKVTTHRRMKMVYESDDE
ncbi:RNA polymerase-associated protein LEO1 [Striga asiatica]|uniref:RNA polymerase-associated protein LEO1 n=1 Tax=Striga asiatica TaxID=4170 RepID=A0A5A7P3N9_STRAF|nr:RNA polymerase-associated protein LEO1 [Striga asiatica]